MECQLRIFFSKLSRVKSNFELTKDTPYFILMSELCGVQYDYFVAILLSDMETHPVQ